MTTKSISDHIHEATEEFNNIKKKMEQQIQVLEESSWWYRYRKHNTHTSLMRKMRTELIKIRRMWVAKFIETSEYGLLGGNNKNDGFLPGNRVSMQQQEQQIKQIDAEIDECTAIQNAFNQEHGTTTAFLVGALLAVLGIISLIIQTNPLSDHFPPPSIYVSCPNNEVHTPISPKVEQYNTLSPHSQIKEQPIHKSWKFRPDPRLTNGHD